MGETDDNPNSTTSAGGSGGTPPNHNQSSGAGSAFQMEPMMALMASILEQNNRMMERLVARDTERTQPAITEIQVKPDITSNIRKFTGLEDDIRAGEWLSEFKKIAELSGWDGRTCLLVSSMQMEGNARDWQSSTGSRCCDWDGWQNAFKDAYMKVADLPRRWRRMMERRQKADEKILDYIRDKERLCEQLQLGVEDTIQQIIQGMWNRQMSFAMLDRTHRSVNDLIKNVKDFDNFRSERELWFGGGEKPKSTGKMPLETKKLSSMTLRDGKEEQAMKSGREFSISSAVKPKAPPIAEVKCFNCQELGHYATSCSKPRASKTCNQCGKEGHIRKDCPEKKLKGPTLCVETASKTARSTRLTTATIDRRTDVPVFVDTGSDSCMMKMSFAAKLGKDIEPLAATEKITVFGGGEETAVGKTTISIAVSKVANPKLDVFIIRDDSFPGPDVLLGRTFLDEPGVTMIRRNGETTLLTDDEFRPFEKLIVDDSPRKIELRATKKTEIKPGFVAWIQMQGTTEDGLYKCLESNNNQEEIEVVCCLMNEKTSMPVVNLTNHTYTIQANQVVRRAMKWNNSEEYDNEGLTAIHQTMDSVDTAEREQELYTSVIAREDVDMGSQLSEDQIEELMEILNSYRRAFAFTSKELGITNLAEMTIEEEENSRPVARAPYPTSKAQKIAVESIVKEMMEAGLIRPSQSDYASPVILVPRKNPGEYRMVIDYRKLNLQTIKDKHPIPRMNDVIDSMSGYCFYTLLDMAQGYLQIPLAEESRRKAAFVTHHGLFEPTRMCFGLTNGPAVYQRMVGRLLQPLPWGLVGSFFDDIAVPADDWGEMSTRLKRLLQLIVEANLTLKLSKCRFAKEEVEFLGLRISKDGITPGAGKLNQLSGVLPPKNIHELRRFLGLTSFFRKFVPNFAQKAAPLTQLLRNREGKKHGDIEWNPNLQRAFDELKEELTKAPTLAPFDDDKETELHTDASSVGIAGMLLQKNTGEDAWRLVQCVSRSTSVVESKYHSSRLELMAVAWSVNRLRPLLLGRKFTILTDCAAIIYINTQKSVQPQVARWVEGLQEYDYEIRYRPGERMQHVDCISRAPAIGGDDEDDPGEKTEMIPGLTTRVLFSATPEDKVLMIQQQDVKIMELLKLCKLPEREKTKEEKAKCANYEVQEGILFRRYGSEPRRLFVLPKSMRKFVCVMNHEFGGHYSAELTVDKILRKYWFSGMRSYVRQHVRSCIECLLLKQPGGKKSGELNPIMPSKEPFSTWHIDHLGPFVTSLKKNTHILVMVDSFTKFVVLRPCPSTQSQHVLKAIRELVLFYGVPRRIVSDRGSCFTSGAFQEYCREVGIKHVLTSTQRAQANGQVERINRVLIPMVAGHAEFATRKDWDVHLPTIMAEMNTTKHKATGYTPYELAFGFNPEFKRDSLGNAINLYPKSQDSVKEMREDAYKNIVTEKQQQKEAYDKHRAPANNYCLGDVVVVKRTPVSTGESVKLNPKYTGPMTILEVLTSDTYRIGSLKSVTRGKYTTTAHADQLKLYKLAIDEGDELDRGLGTEDPIADEFENSVTEPTSSEVIDTMPSESEEGSVPELRNEEGIDKMSSDEVNTEMSIPLTVSGKRPSRSRKKPAKLADYVLD